MFLQIDNKENEYTTIGKRFPGYTWYKPVLVYLLTITISSAFQVALLFVAAVIMKQQGEDTVGFMQALDQGYDAFDVYSLGGALVRLGGIAVMLPALFYASAIIKDRPFSTYSCSVGTWDNRLFGKGILVGLLVSVIPNIILATTATKERGDNRLTFAIALVILVLCPVQSIAEEYLYRGLFMQSIGSWTGIPLLAVLVQTLLFISTHPYNITGTFAVAVSGLCLGLVAHYSSGLEMGSAFHTCNNISVLMLTGLGYGTIKSTVSPVNMLFTVTSNIFFLLAVYYMDRKNNAFERVPKD